MTAPTTPAFIGLLVRHPAVLVTVEHTHKQAGNGTCTSCPGSSWPCVQVRCATEAKSALGWSNR